MASTELTVDVVIIQLGEKGKPAKVMMSMDQVDYDLYRRSKVRRNPFQL